MILKKSLELHTDDDENKEKQPIAFISRALNDREIRYSVTEKEALALVWAVDKLHIYTENISIHSLIINHSNIFSNRVVN